MKYYNGLVDSLGRVFLQSVIPLALSPLGGGLDDAPQVAMALANNAYIRPVQLAAGTWNWKTPVTVPSGSVILGTAGTRIVSTMAPSGVQTNSIFYAKAVASANTGTLNGAPGIGSSTLSYTLVTGVEPSIGDILQVSHNLSAQVFKIINIAGGGPYTITLDRPITVPFSGGDPCAVLTSRPTDIVIDGNGMSISGTGDRVVEIVTGYRCVVKNMSYDTVDGAMTDMCFSYDIGGVENVFENLYADGSGAPGSLYGYALEANDNSYMYRCFASHIPNRSHALIDSVSCGIRDGGYSGTGVGIGIGTGGSLGCFDCWVTGFTADGGTASVVTDTCARTRINNCTFNYPTAEAILLNSATTVQLELTDVAIGLLANTKGVVAAAGGGAIISARNVKFSGSGIGTTAFDLTNATLRGSNLDMTSCATDVTLGAAGYKNWGQFTTTATVLANVVWPNIKANDKVVLQRVADSGTGVFPTIVITPSTGFSHTGAGGDSSTYDWLIPS